MAKKSGTTALSGLLVDWVSLNAGLGTLSEAELGELLHLEQTGKNRPTYVRRIHTRLSRVRTVRERKELL